MSCGPALTNNVSILYEYTVSANDEKIEKYAYGQKSIQVKPEIDICFSKCNNKNRCGCIKRCNNCDCFRQFFRPCNYQRHCITAYNYSKYPIQIKMKIFYPSYVYYDPLSFIINGRIINIVRVNEFVNFGIIKPDGFSNVEYSACRMADSSAIKHESRVEIYYRFIVPGQDPDKWYCIEEDRFII